MLDGFLVEHLNVRSLLAHFDEFRDYLSQSDCGVFGVSETWLNGDIGDGVLHVEGFHFLRVDRLTRGGGVGLYVGHCYECRVIDVQQTAGIEQLWVRVSLNGINVAFGIFYRPPSYDFKLFIEIFRESLAQVYPTVDQVVILGDFNVDLLVATPSGGSLLNCIESFNLKQIINEATRVSYESQSLLDLILISNNIPVMSYGTKDLGFSDHLLVYGSISLNKCKTYPRTICYRNLRNIKVDEFRRDVDVMNWEGVYDFATIDEKIDHFNTVILSLFDFHAPLVTKTIKKDSLPWITFTIKQMMTLRDSAFRRFKRTRTHAHFLYYKELRNLVTAAVRREKKVFLERNCVFADSRSAWRTLKRFNIVKSSNSCLPQHLSDANAINSYFNDVVRDTVLTSDADLLDFYKTNKLNSCNFAFVEVSDSCVASMLLSMKSRGVGSDGISLDMVRLCCPRILGVLSHLFNCCLSGSVFPTVWKYGLVTPVPKSKSVKELKDLRPITILPMLSKVLERIIAEQLRDHLLNNNILPEKQSGFRKHYSCATALLDLTDDVFRALDDGKSTMLFLLDFSKAFDILDHDLLLAILRFIGLSVPAVDLFKSYLSGRTQSVKLHYISDPVVVTSGVPQGSIIGPIMFTIYTCNLFSKLKFLSHHLYADDTQLYCSFLPDDLPEVCDRVECELNCLHSEIEKHALKVNSDKTQCILFTKKGKLNIHQDQIDIFLRGNRLSFSESVTSLGVVIDDQLNFERHVSRLCGRAFSSLRSLYVSRKVLSVEVKRLLCDSLVLSHFNYCDVVFGPCMSYEARRRVQVVQNSCIRFIYGIGRGEHTSGALASSGWLTMRQRNMLHYLSLIYSIVSTGKPPYLCRKISYRTDVHNLNLRHRFCVTVPAHRTSKFRSCFSYQVARLWNLTPPSAKCASSSSAFKHIVKREGLLSDF